MKILFILDEFLPENSGGAANVAFWLAKGLVKAGHDVLVLTATNNLNKEGNIEIENVKIKIIFTKPFSRLRNWKNLKNRGILRQASTVLEDFKPDIIHIHTLHHRFSYGVIRLATQFTKAVFLTLHDAQTIYNGKLYPKRKICDLNPKYDYRINWLTRLRRDGLTYNPFQFFFIKRALKKANKIFTVSGALKEAIEANGILGIEVMHNGINVEQWEIFENRGNDILFAGRVDEAKGVRALIEAFGAVNSEIPDATLTIVGDGDFSPFEGSPEGGKIEKNENIKILPWQDRESMKKLFSESTTIVVPSLYLDPFPTVNLEAMAAGKPVVGTCFGGTPEVVADGETGYIVNPYNEKELAEKIIDLLKNPGNSKLFGVNGKHRIEKFFGLDEQIQKILNWYQKFL